MADESWVDAETAAAHRRAAALFQHWRNGRPDSDGEMEIFNAIRTEDEWMILACALLSTGWNLARAAKDGREIEYLADVVRRAALDEVTLGG